MLKQLDRTDAVPKEAYKALEDRMERDLPALQRRLLESGVPVLVIFEGWEASGKGTAINELIHPMDPRGFKVYTTIEPDAEERRRPFLWRFWIRSPAGGRIAIFDRSWYERTVQECIADDWSDMPPETRLRDILAMERQLVDSGVLLIKFFLHISRKEQARRFRNLEANPATRWRVDKADWKRNRHYKKLRALYENLLRHTHTPAARWNIIPAGDRRTAVAAIWTAFAREARARLRRRPTATGRTVARRGAPAPRSPLATADLSASMTRKQYKSALEPLQRELRDLEHEIYRHGIPVVIVYEGWDAAGKGGNIKRLTERLDPRGYEVIPIAAPSPVEKAHHYLWRFWTQMPKTGHIAIFDRSWYGRVLVERVEGFCNPAEWQRAYTEINEMEAHLVHCGVVLVKFWVHISPATQLARFRERQHTPDKRWKITDEDWRNRRKWRRYEQAVDDMLIRTGTRTSPWTILESDCKYHARIKALETVTGAIRARMKNGLSLGAAAR